MKLISLLAILWSVHSIALNPLANTLDMYETVNGYPQISIQSDNFQAHWSVWRQLTSAEKKELWPLKNQTHHLISKRTIRWEMLNCTNSSLITQNQENLFFDDEIQFVPDQTQRIIPLREALRTDYRYFVLINFDSRKLTQEKNISRTYGSLQVTAVHRLYKFDSKIDEDKWLRLEDSLHFSSQTSEQTFQKLQILNSDLWPINPDERAHKKHRIEAPSTWNSAAPISEHEIKMRINWNACSEKIKMEALIPEGTMLRPGPNRPFRDDHGDSTLIPIEIKNW